jgi:hypothetical protein
MKRDPDNHHREVRQFAERIAWLAIAARALDLLASHWLSIELELLSEA